LIGADLGAIELGWFVSGWSRVLSMSKFECEVAVIGAGPYGLSVASHLKAAGIETKVFGETMSFWRKHMPKGMKLRSTPAASDLSDPKGELTFEAFAAGQAARPPVPIPLGIFVSYGEWFKQNTLADLDTRKVERVDSLEDGFCLWLDDGGHVTAQRVVVATGLARQEFRPAAFSGLPRDYVSSVCEHVDVSVFRGKRVAVVGRGQSACEYAALLNEAGADVELVGRGDVHWLGSERPADQPEDLIWRLHKLLATPSGVGPFPINWLAETPGPVRRMPRVLREMINTRGLRPGATSWLKPGFAGVKTGPGRNILEARVQGSKIVLRSDSGATEHDHVLLATGYRSDIGKLNLFAPRLLEAIRCVDGSPELSTGLQSSVPNLYFVGSSAVMSYGPLMRFIAGSGYAARHVTRYILAQRALGRTIKDGNKSIVTAATGIVSRT
jgi:cation diffusion facilitator CzcD-associated flavoprotein CzcO